MRALLSSGSVGDFSDSVGLRELLREAERLAAPLREFQRTHSFLLEETMRAAEERERLLRSLKPLDAEWRNAIAALQPSLEYLEAIRVDSPALRILGGANSTLATILERQSELEKLTESARLLGTTWRSQIEPLLHLSEASQAARLSLESHYARIAEVTIAAQRFLADVPWDSVGAALRGMTAEVESIKGPFLEFTHSYSGLVRSFEQPELAITSLPPVVSGVPPVEVFTASDLLAHLSRPEPLRSDDDVELRRELSDEIEESLEGLLWAVDPALIATWRGAKQALSSDNPDRARHVAISLRELLTHVLQRIAPDARVESWTSDPEHFHDGRPTREARLLYLCRTIDHGPFSGFVRKDVASTVSFIGLFQRGTHKIQVDFSESQLRLLVLRAESLLRFLLSIDRID